MKSIVSLENGVPVLENNIGCKLVTFREGNGFGLGTFFVNGVKVGGTVTYFVAEESLNQVYKATGFEILENTSETGKVRFTGKDGKLEFTATIALFANCSAYHIDFEFDPVHPIYHPLYLNVPFDSSRARFIKYPYEDTLNPDFKDRWTLIPDRGRVPFLFGCVNIGGRECFVGVGYPMNDNFTEGRFEYEPQAYPDAPFKIYTPFHGMARPVDLQCVTRLELLRTDLEEDYQRVKRKFQVIIATAENQYACIRGYAEQSQYNPHVPLKRSIDDSVGALMGVYKRIPGYIEGKGYPQLIRFSTGDFDTTFPHGWYSKFLVIAPQIQLAHELYLYWKKNQNETWARDRAIQIADFAVKMQSDNGAFTTWDIDRGGTTFMHPQNVEGTKFNAHIYSTSDIAFGTVHLFKLYEEMKAFEGVERGDWRDSALKAVRYLAGLVGDDGQMGRNYNISGEYDKENTQVAEVLIALDYISARMGDNQLASVRDRLEKWIYEHYIKINNWCNGSVDGGAWQGAGWPPPHNNDNMGALTFASYCVYRHLATGEARFLQMAKDVVMYQWLTVVPVQVPGCQRSTKGLVREQDFYSAYDIPFKGKELVDCLAYLSKVTGDPFFMQYYRMMIQTQMDYQAMDQPNPAFYIGLESNATGKEPINKLAEANMGYIIRFASLFLKSMNSPLAYRYVGGEGWGIGLDYNLPFNPDFGKGAPFVLSASTMVRDINWDPEKRIMAISLYDRMNRDGSLEIQWKPELGPVDRVTLLIDDSEAKANQYYHSLNQIIRIPYQHRQPTVNVYLHCCGEGSIK